MSLTRLTLDHPALADKTGRGITVAIIDSGLNAGHPHVGREAVGVEIRLDGSLGHDLIDRLGHGTAVAAAILERAPGVALNVIKVFDRTLTASGGQLVDALAWAVQHRVRIVNLSLGTESSDHEASLSAAVASAVRAGCLVVAARDHAGRRWLPGGLPDVAGVLLDWTCPREEIWLDPAHTVFRATGHPRPIPGVPAERNLSGISFAVAAVSGFLARVMEGTPETRRLNDVLGALR